MHKSKSTGKTKRAFIIGGGTSFKEVYEDKSKKAKLKKAGTLFGCNKAVDFIDCDYMIFLDVRFPGMCPDIISNFNGHGGVHAPSLHKVENERVKNVNYFKVSSKPATSFVTGIFISNNTGTAALAFAIAKGFKEIYLLGIDCRFSEDKKETHFHGGYGNDKMLEQNYGHMAKGFWRLGEWLMNDRPDVSVYNCSELSLLTIDEFIDHEGNIINFSKMYPYKDINEVLDSANT